MLINIIKAKFNQIAAFASRRWDARHLLSILDFVCILLISLVVLLAYIIPELYTFFHLVPFTWQNAWDKCTYLSYQGSLGSLAPGYLTSYIVFFLQNIGIAGATQSLLFDLFLPGLSVYFLFNVFKQYNIKPANALAFAIIILFSSVLFNFCNPYIHSHFASHQFSHILVGIETYPSILRSPNPQISYFLISLTIYLFNKYKKLFILVLPVPFLYYFVVVPYIYILASLFVILKTKYTKSFAQLIFIHLILFATFSLMAYVLFNSLQETVGHIKAMPSLYQTGRTFYLNLVGLLGCMLLLVAKVFGLFTRNRKLEYIFISIVLCSFTITNLQLFNNFMLSIKNYQDYGNSIVGGMILALFFYLGSLTNVSFFISVVLNIFRYFVLFLIAFWTLHSQGFNYHTKQFTILLGGTITNEQLQRIRKDPLHAIITDATFAQCLPFTEPKMLASVFAYQYDYLSIEKQCEYNEILFSAALQYIQKHCNELGSHCADLLARSKLYFNSLRVSKSFPYKNKSYCNYQTYTNTDFFIIVPSHDNSYVRFPS